MKGFKSLLASKTFWGAAVSLGSKLLVIMGGVELDPGDQTVAIDTLVLLVGGIGDLVAIYGRYVARKLIGSPAA